MLGQSLEHVGCETHHAKGDADVLTVETTVQYAMSCETTSVGDGTDLLVLLCSHVREDSCEVFFKPEIRSGTEKSPRCWNIKYVQRVLGLAVCNNMLFARAILGCDTTSRVFSTGKGHALKHIRSYNHFITKAVIILQENATVADISSTGEAALLCLYTSALGGTLDKIEVAALSSEGLKAQVVSLQTAHSWANAGVLLGDACIGSGVAFEAIKLLG